jgi:hypothetical protein
VAPRPFQEILKNKDILKRKQDNRTPSTAFGKAFTRIQNRMEGKNPELSALLNFKNPDAYFEKYAFTLPVPRASLFYAIDISLFKLPLNTKNYSGLVLELYSSDKKYIMSFYTKDFWNESGYTKYNEYWHEKVLTDRILVNFPEKGQYYFLVSVPKTKSRDAFYADVLSAGNGKGEVEVRSYEYVRRPVSDSAALFVIGFLIFGFILYKTMTPGINEKKIFNKDLDFENYDYIIRVFTPATAFEEQIFFVKGVSQIKKSGALEFILERDGNLRYLEVEKEYEEGKTYYYCYLYRDLEEGKFSEIPKRFTIQFQGKEMRREDKKKKDLVVSYSTKYFNGLEEEGKFMEINYGTANEKYWLSFQYKDDPSEFDVSYGEDVPGFRIWKVKK